MKTMLFFLLCSMTFCLPFKNKPLADEPDAYATTAPAASLNSQSASEVESEDSTEWGHTADAGANAAEPVSAEAAAGKVNPVSFEDQIQPILQTRCNPCHFPGGKMYEKMPFDQAKTIIGHQEGVLKRFTDEAENKLLRQFLEEAGK